MIKLFLLVTTVLVIIALKIPIELFFTSLNWDLVVCDWASQIMTKSLLLFIALVWIFYDKFVPINGFPHSFRIENPHALLFPFSIIIVIAINKINIYSSVDIGILILFFTMSIVTGFSEELVFRGIMIPTFLKNSKKSKKNIIFSVLTSALIFGLFHYINYAKNPNFEAVTSQVVFTFCMGTFLGGLFLRTANILPCAIWHGVFNFSLNTDLLLNLNTLDNHSTQIENETNLTSFIITLIVWLIIMVSGLLMAYWTKKDDMYKKIHAWQNY